MKLDKFLNKTYYASSSDAKKLIKQGKVLVNDTVIKDPSFNITENVDVIKLNGEVIRYKENYYYILNKPSNYVTSTSDTKNKTIMELFSNLPLFLQKNLFPVGRLDLDTEGLIIVTTDGEFSHKVTSPKSDIEKMYYVEFDGIINPDAKNMISKPFEINNELYKPAKIDIITANSAYITISEGKYHQIKKMTHYLGVCLTHLKRVSIGQLSLPQDLEIGHYIEISEEEIKKLTNV